MASLRTSNELRAGIHGVMYVRFRPEPTRIAMPDVCCDLVWVREKLYVAGPASRGQPIRWPGEDMVLLNIEPLVAREWLGVPMTQLIDRTVELRDIDRVRAAPLEEMFHAGQAKDLVRSSVGARKALTRIAAAAAAIRSGTSLAQAATEAALSERQLERVFMDQLGHSPRMYRRILRLRAALQLAASGQSLAEAAVTSGYADQAHFTRDVRDFMGDTPRAVTGHVGKIQDAHVYAREY